MSKPEIVFFLFSLAIAPGGRAQAADTILSVHFESGLASFNGPEMTGALRFLKSIHGKIKMVSGYADSIGNATSNLRLSEERCISVIKTLKQFGIRTSIEFEGKGELKTSKNGNLASSRRVDIDVSYDKPAIQQSIADFNEQISHLDLNDIQFLPDVPAMEPASLLYLPDVLSILNRFRHAHYNIIGYVNWITNHPENRNSGYAKKMQELSEGRAKAIYEWLADNGIDKSRMSYEGKSNDSLIFKSPVTDAQKERNMRVQIIITDSVPKKANNR